MPANKTIGDIPLGEKMNLTVAEASVYTNIGQVTLRNKCKEPDCNFVFWIGPQKSLIRRQEFERIIFALKMCSLTKKKRKSKTQRKNSYEWAFVTVG